MVHGDGDRQLERAKNFREDNANAAASTPRLARNRFAKDKSEFIAANAKAESEVRRAFFRVAAAAR